MNMLPTRFVALLSVVACTIVAIVSLWPATQDVRTEDRNGDGRPDVWRVYDHRGQLVEVALDTNFDGRSDVHEYYDRGALVRRETDRDFNDRVDLVEDFDPTTHEHVRSTIDVDYDGTADLLILFQRGQPVYSQWTHPVHKRTPGGVLPAPSGQIAHRKGADQLAPLSDPFRTDTVVRGAHAAFDTDGCVGLSTAGGLPAVCMTGVGPWASSAPVSAHLVQPDPPPPFLPRSPRGPPRT